MKTDEPATLLYSRWLLHPPGHPRLTAISAAINAARTARDGTVLELPTVRDALAIAPTHRDPMTAYDRHRQTRASLRSKSSGTCCGMRASSGGNPTT